MCMIATTLKSVKDDDEEENDIKLEDDNECDGSINDNYLLNLTIINFF